MSGRRRFRGIAIQQPLLGWQNCEMGFEERREASSSCHFAACGVARCLWLGHFLMLLRCWLFSSFVDLFGFEVGGKDFEKAKTKEICVGVLAVVCFYFIHTIFALVFTKLGHCSWSSREG